LQPEHFFSCSQTGDVWHWNAAARVNFSNQQLAGAKLTDAPGARWFANEATKHRVETVELLPSQKLPVNTLDIRAGRDLLVAGDNEAVYVISNVFL